jgi:hypothetical protein
MPLLPLQEYSVRGMYICKNIYLIFFQKHFFINYRIMEIKKTSFSEVCVKTETLIDTQSPDGHN